MAATKFGVTKHPHIQTLLGVSKHQLLRFKTLFAHAIFVFGNTDFDVCRHYKSASLQQLRCFVTLTSGLRHTYYNGRRCYATLCGCFITLITVSEGVSAHNISVSLHLLQCRLVFRYTPLVFHYTDESVSLHIISVSLHLLQGKRVLRYTRMVFGCMHFRVYTGVLIHYLNVTLPLKSGHIIATTRFSVTKH